MMKMWLSADRTVHRMWLSADRTGGRGAMIGIFRLAAEPAGRFEQ
jgi:hypothetical protein